MVGMPTEMRLHRTPRQAPQAMRARVSWFLSLPGLAVGKKASEACSRGALVNEHMPQRLHTAWCAAMERGDSRAAADCRNKYELVLDT